MVRKIVLSLIAILGLCVYGFAQSRQISGTVTGADGTPIVGATVLIDGTQTGTTSGSDGSFMISAPANGTLLVTYIGYVPQRVAIGAKTRVDITMQEDAQAIDDVIVVAFGEAKKDAFTGSAKVIRSDELIKTQSSNVQDALVGKVAGVQFTSLSGRPGSGQTITVRGSGSLNAGTGPLWIVDGVPYEGDINNINNADIESVNVLKDAASNALYGARGANGVIMVTTKRAKAGEASVTFDGKWGINTRALQTYDIVEEAGEYYEMHYKSLYNYYTLAQNYDALSANIAANKLLTSNTAGGLGYNVFTVPEGQNLIGENGRLNPRAREGRLVSYDGQDYLLKPDNWLDEIYKSASFRQEYNVSVAGATERSNFYASLGYLDNTGIVDGSHQERYTARLRADYQAKKWLKVGANMSYAHFVWKNGNQTNATGTGQGEGNADGGNAFATAIRMAPIYPIYMRDGNGKIMVDQYGMKLYDTGDGRNGGALRSNGGKSNDLQDIQLNKYISEGNQFSANGFADISLYDGLKLTVNGSVIIDESRHTSLRNPYYGQFADSGGAMTKQHTRLITYNLQQLLTYKKTFADVHNLDLLLGHEMYDSKDYGLAASKTVMFSPDNLELSGFVVDGANSSSSVAKYNNEGYIFRGQYDYDNRMYFSGSYRREASSRFHPDNRWGNFWSVGGAWIINRESWFNAPWVDMLKVKASYGSQGNDNIGNYMYVDYYSIENDGNNGVTTVFYRKGNPDITWETNANLNVGVEFGFWNNRLSGGIDFFNRKTTDMLMSMATPMEAGYTTLWTNVGDMRNRGIEIDLSAILMRTKNLVWDFSLNMTHLKNKLVKMPDQYKNNITSDGKRTGRIDGTKFLSEGISRYTFYIPTYAGVDPETGKSLWYTYQTDAATGEKERVTTDQYSVASENGRELHGDATPDVFGGFGTSLRFYGVDFSVGFTYQIGGQVLDSGYQFYMGSPTGTSTGNNYHHDLLKSWTPQNSGSNIPRFAYNDTNMAATSDRFLTDASYLNIQNITLGYTLPKRITRKFLVESLRIYFACDNVWYWSKRQGLDPRQGINGIVNPYYYAPIRTFSGGITVTF
ncbi:TonB-dependent receptor [uncultured Alistipes sp.]|uniref:SusC/RagA family TonB-linked outer membrane protein n=1 Tax=uncultured Alistipes sp. TaxID=538949 RepID=UPI0025F83120|nr:TonB-dependent receptor [uncultured Alistipes sp.]